MNTHYFNTTTEAYDACQWNEDIKFGDVLIIESEGVVGVADVWPFALTENTGDLHGLTDRSEAGLSAYLETRKREIESLFNKAVDIDVEALLSLFSQDKETNNGDRQMITYATFNMFKDQFRNGLTSKCEWSLFLYRTEAALLDEYSKGCDAKRTEQINKLLFAIDEEARKII